MVPGGSKEIEPDDLLSKRHAGQSVSLNLLKYFISADADLPPSYVKRCERFLKKFTSRKKQASTHKQAGTHKRHQKNTKVFKTLQDAIIYNAKKRS